MKLNLKFIFTLMVSVAAGLLIEWIDSRPNWDDTGITATLLFVVAAAIGYYYKKYPLVWGLAVGMWVPLLGTIRSNDYLMLIVLVFGLTGSFSGYIIRKIVTPQKSKKKK